jgi:hypothetical protein
MARFGKFLWLLEDLVFLYFEKRQPLESLFEFEVWLWLLLIFLVTGKVLK